MVHQVQLDLLVLLGKQVLLVPMVNRVLRVYQVLLAPLVPIPLSQRFAS